MTGIEITELCLLGLSPLLAIGAAMVLYNIYVASRRKELLLEQDKSYEREYLLWWESVKGHHGLVPVFCPVKTLTKEKCYLFIHHASLYEAYEPQMPKGFDVACGVTVDRRWSVMDQVGAVAFLGHCRICVMASRIYVKSGLVEINIPLEEITSVVASCSALMIDSESLDQPLIFRNINGQQLRDTIHVLVNEAKKIAPFQ